MNHNSTQFNKQTKKPDWPKWITIQHSLTNKPKKPDWPKWITIQHSLTNKPKKKPDWLQCSVLTQVGLTCSIAAKKTKPLNMFYKDAPCTKLQEKMCGLATLPWRPNSTAASRSWRRQLHLSPERPWSCSLRSPRRRRRRRRTHLRKITQLCSLCCLEETPAELVYRELFFEITVVKVQLLIELKKWRIRPEAWTTVKKIKSIKNLKRQTGTTTGDWGGC